jgi:beta-xylosidase
MGRDHDGNGIGEPVTQFPKPAVGKGSSVAVPQTSDEFDSTKLGLQWQWHANHDDNWYSLTARPGWLLLFSRNVEGSDLAKVPNLLLQKTPARSFTVETRLEFSPQSSGEEAGLVVMGRAYAALALQSREHGLQLVFRDNGKDVFTLPLDGNRVKLRVAFDDGGLCRFSFAADEGLTFTTIPHTFQAQAGVWIGAKIGIYSLKAAEGAGGHADFDYFRFS